jgi:signal transduction histidine kinase
VHIACYRITQEALNNIVKHAKGGKIRITLQTTPPVSTVNADKWSGTIALTIADDGVGFVANGKVDGQMGLASMRERARSIKASLNIDSTPGSGTTVKLTWRGATVTKVRNTNHERYTD